MEQINLLGAEDVRRAGSTISSAASDMMRAANIISEALQEHQRRMDDFLIRLEQLFKKEG